jgi:hypothetical protein
MKRFLPALALLLLSTAAQAAEWPRASLFFNLREEQQALSAARQAFPAGGGLRLGAILYFGEDDWTLWLQGEKWRPDTRRDDIRILSVTPQAVELIWRDENGEEVKLKLHPNESALGKTKE